MEENSSQEAGSRPVATEARSEPALSRDISEDEGLSVLERASLNAEILASIARAPVAQKSRKLAFALVAHPRTPRHLSIPLLRRMFTFDLLKLALSSAVAPDLKRVAEEQIILRLEALTVGERISLARRSPSSVVAALVTDRDARVVSAALGNSRLREASLTKALMGPGAPAILFRKISEHPKWVHRREIQIALLRSEQTPIETVGELARRFPAQVLEDILPQSRRALIQP